MKTMAEVAMDIFVREPQSQAATARIMARIMKSTVEFHRQDNFTVAVIQSLPSKLPIDTFIPFPRAIVGVAKRSKADPVKPLVGRMTALARATRRLISEVAAEVASEEEAKTLLN